MILGINPYFIFNGHAKEAVAFYEKALAAEVLGVMTFGDLPADADMLVPSDAKERVMHAHLKIGETDLMLSDNFPGQPYTEGTNVTVAVNLDNSVKAEEVYSSLVEGGKDIMPLQATQFSPAYGQVIDKYGVTWHISTQVPENR
ncbi:VOC family protein [Salipaludibacillus sp. LMS25]|jgi:PhnB protein|uniref:VOC family protein n=1 Tax=Salipaludibacillus sp. LMS25 TaxID=2924031 RepID=UPI0020D03907|nr:VOC family protein [Salipaludibacillus sp. LMS25]UTR17012.1 VOC family protein [Salipaludibacillus sp. LMS25]